ncbi:MAG: PD-(D/E)XK nuclease family protein [Campylobacterales bacterium]|nr:PD-(D/E)XK nuclease family protein [Campylobacterales bacterium]
MSLQRECIVFPTARCIRSALERSEESILPHYMTMGEFLSRSAIAEGRIVPDDDLRLLALHEASDFGAFSTLNIERNFFSFIHNAQYIFRFFEELSSEKVSVETLREVDVYGEYEEHITILIHLRNRYREICERNGWVDRIFLSETSRIDTGFLNHFDSVHIEVEGYLSRRELEILVECAEVTSLSLTYHTTPYNRKMSQRLEEFGFSLEEGRSYRLSLSQRSVLSSTLLNQGKRLHCELFHNRLAQVGFIKAKVEAFVDMGIAPEKIAVVLPDESFATLLKEFDDEGNFNFAMGEGFEYDPFYRQIESIVLYLEESNVLNRARIRAVSVRLIDWIRERYSRPFRFEDLYSLLELVESEGEKVPDRVREELQRFSHLCAALESMDFKTVLRMFMNRLKNLSIDDVRGGKITVMGLLETRGVEFEGVVVVDFNEGFVPHKSEKDLFLNTKTRQYAALPTSQDRESLQKHYYAMLFNRACHVAIATVQNAESVPSRFLLQLGIPMTEAEYRYEQVLFPPMAERPKIRQECAGEYDFTAHPLSASSLKSFLTCRRQFYYRYVLHLTPHELPRDLSQERDIGNALHAALESLYQQRDQYDSPQELREGLRTMWEVQASDDPLERHMKRLWLDKLGDFFDHEAQRFSEGWRVAHREKELSVTVEGITLVGRVDRIDGRKGELEVIDYKSGKYPDTDKEPKENDVDYQLSVYAFLASTLGTVAHCGYYDLGRGELKREQYMEGKKERLREILAYMASQKVWEWEMCEELSRCRLCPYVYLCHREAMRGV